VTPAEFSIILQAGAAFLGIVAVGWLLTPINDSITRQSRDHARLLSKLRRIAEEGRR
jgi:hypothetical protein